MKGTAGRLGVKQVSLHLRKLVKALQIRLRGESKRTVQASLLINLLSSYLNAQLSQISPKCRDTLDPTQGAKRTFLPEVLTYTAGQGKRPLLHQQKLASISLIPRSRACVIPEPKCLKKLQIYSSSSGVQSICAQLSVDVRRCSQSCKPRLVIGRCKGVGSYRRTGVVALQ